MVELAYGEGGVGFWGRIRQRGDVVLVDEQYDQGFYGSTSLSSAVAAFLNRHGLHAGG